MVSKHRKALLRRQARGTTYKLVHRPRNDENNGDTDGDGMEWVKEEDLRRNHAPRKRGNDYEDHENYEDYYDDDDGDEWVDNDAGDFYEEEEIDDEDGLHINASQPPKRLSGHPPSESTQKKIGGSDDIYADELTKEWKGYRENTAAHASAGPRQYPKHDTNIQEEQDDADDDDKLFDDEVECEVTDNFLRQLVFGTGNDAGDGDAFSETDADAMKDKDDDDRDHEGERYGIPQDAWQLLTDEEKAGVRAANARGAALGRSKVTPNAELGVDAVTAQPYPVHNITQRAIDRQFTEMMREFDVDAQINDAYTNDPRTHGALPMDKYLGALKEFVVERAGVNYSTSEPAKNKGLIHQLELLAYRAGAFDADSRGGVYKTTLASEKKARFAEEFRRETEQIRAEAALRLSRKALAENQEVEETYREQQPRRLVSFNGEDAVSSGEALPKLSETSAEVDLCSNRNLAKVHDGTPDQDNVVTCEPEEEEEEFRIAIIKSRDKRLDCETAVSVYSTYYNQPNVIRSTTTRGKQKSKRKVLPHDGDLKTSGVILDSYKKASGVNESSEGGKDKEDCNSSHSGTGTLQTSAATPILTLRSKDETKEEKKMRRQAVKMAQRERRQEKSALKKAYQTVGEMEKKRANASQTAKRTVHFL
ncbi:unnamed protein product [Phytomonas sp. EM1]|nr:unnamed protein product [Phytomonas sp. EM1]|eukprot:CCW59647.1 unnamed protein product [Phytomonas sp. isolate EM1]